MRRILLSVFAALFLASMAYAQDEVEEVVTYYKWVTDEGVFAFTDDSESIPLLYRGVAEEVETRSLASYARLSVFPESPKRDQKPKQVESMENRLIRLRSLNAEVAIEEQLFRRAEPFFATREMRWLDGVLGSPGSRYVSVDVLYDGDGNEIASSLSSIGIASSGVYVDIGSGVPPSLRFIADRINRR